MSAKPLSRVGMLFIIPIFALASAGCSSNPPCETDLAAVDEARSAAKAAEDKLEAAQQHFYALAIKRGKVDYSNISFELSSGTRSCGRLGPASDGFTSPMSSSSTSV